MSLFSICLGWLVSCIILTWISLSKGYEPFEPLVGGLLGVALLLFGLYTIKVGAGPLKEFEWFAESLKFESAALILGRLVTEVLSFIAQSVASACIRNRNCSGYTGVLVFSGAG